MARALLTLVGTMRAGILVATLALGACTTATDDVKTASPNAGFLRDFLEGKFDGAGHPLNARVTEAEAICAAAGAQHDGAIRLRAGSSGTCVGPLSGYEQQGDMVASVRLHVQSAAASGSIVSASIVGTAGEKLATQSLSASQLRNAEWIDLPLTWSSDGAPVNIRITPSAGAVVDVDYVELFPQRFGLVASPGSGVLADADTLVFELPKSHKLDKVLLDGTDITARLTSLVTAGTAKRTTTEFRTIVEVAVGDLAPDRDDSAELELRAGTLAARSQLRRAAAPCNFEGSPTGKKVLITGFQPFPADAWHENVSTVAVTSLDPTQLRDAAVMRVVLPVEYDRAAAEVTEIIERCAPDAVISFGQGGGEIALEHTAYNLQDTGEVAGGVPDNRGIIRAAVQIDSTAPATRETLLPLDAIQSALEDAGESPQPSTDPGRYICNNVMFADIGAMAVRGGVGGFIHLPYTTQFDADARARFGRIALAAVQATADSLR